MDTKLEKKNDRLELDNDWKRTISCKKCGTPYKQTGLHEYKPSCHHSCNPKRVVLTGD